MQFNKSSMSLGLYAGLVVSGFFILLLLLARLAGGDGSGLPSGLTYAELILIYLGAGIIGGALFGLLLPIGQRWYGAMLLGVLVISPLFLGQAYFASDHLGSGSFGGAIVSSVLLGSFGGWYAWSTRRKDGGGQEGQ